MTLNTFQAAYQLTLSAFLDAQGNTTTSPFTQPQWVNIFNTITTLAAGTGSGQIDTLIAQPRLLAASGTEDLNFFDGSLKDVNNAANGLQKLMFASVWQIANADGTTAASSITIGGSASNGLKMNFGNVNDTWTVTKAGSVFNAGIAAGYTVDNTHKLVTVLNNDGSNKATYLLVAGGVKI